jgi:hypothetical protein
MALMLIVDADQFLHCHAVCVWSLFAPIVKITLLALFGEERRLVLRARLTDANHSALHTAIFGYCGVILLC